MVQTFGDIPNYFGAASNNANTSFFQFGNPADVEYKKNYSRKITFQQIL